MNQQNDKILLPLNYQSMPSPELDKIRAQMAERIDVIDKQIMDALQKNPPGKPDRFGSADWHIRARRAQDYYRRDIRRIEEHIRLYGRSATGINTIPGSKATQKIQSPGADLNTVKLLAHFKAVARIRLTESLFECISEEAKELLAAEKQGA